MTPSSGSVLFITLDSCRYDTFAEADAPAMKSVSPLFRAQAPSHFTYGSHAAMFVGFTPGVATANRRFINPKWGRLFRMQRAGNPGIAEAGFTLEGADIVDGFRNRGYRTIGSAAMAWFDPAKPCSQVLIGRFDQFLYVADEGVDQQVQWLMRQMDEPEGADQFVFLNVGETHSPYHFAGAPWPREDNPCRSFQTEDRAETCRERQRLCCEFVDAAVTPLIERFKDATTIVCADHGDCWGEDGLWEHGISHEKTLEVPLLIRYRGRPTGVVEPV